MTCIRVRGLALLPCFWHGPVRPVGCQTGRHGADHMPLRLHARQCRAVLCVMCARSLQRRRVIQHRQQAGRRCRLLITAPTAGRSLQPGHRRTVGHCRSLSHSHASSSCRRKQSRSGTVDISPLNVDDNHSRLFTAEILTQRKVHAGHFQNILGAVHDMW